MEKINPIKTETKTTNQKKLRLVFRYDSIQKFTYGERKRDGSSELELIMRVSISKANKADARQTIRRKLLAEY